MENKECFIKLCWVVNVWTKWQIVIPKDIRDKLDIKSGDTMAVVLNDDKYIWLVKNEDLNELMSYVSESK